MMMKNNLKANQRIKKINLKSIKNYKYKIYKLFKKKLKCKDLQMKGKFL